MYVITITRDISIYAMTITEHKVMSRGVPWSGPTVVSTLSVARVESTCELKLEAGSAWKRGTQLFGQRSGRNTQSEISCNCQTDLF